MADFKVIEKTLQSGSNILEVTDATLNNDSIFEVYTDDANVIPVGVTVSGTTASITFDSIPTSATGVKIFINNLDGEYTPPMGDRVEITDAEDYGSLVCKISINGEVTELRTGTISSNQVRYYDSHGSDMTQFEFNNSVTDRLDNLDASDILYDENSTVYSAMGDVDSLTTTSKNLVGAINEVASSGGVGEVVDISDKLTASSKTTLISSFAKKYGKLININARFDATTQLSQGHNVIGNISDYIPDSSNRVIIAANIPPSSNNIILVGSLRVGATGYNDGDISVYLPSVAPVNSQFQFNLMFLIS